MRQLNLGLGGNLEDRHEELECQRQPLLNSVLGKSLEYLHEAHDHEKLDCQRSARRTAAGARRETRRSALPSTVTPSADDEDRSLPNAPGCSLERSWALR